jgi:outer membrane protein assembly factor BamB
MSSLCAAYSVVNRPVPDLGRGRRAVSAMLSVVKIPLPRCYLSSQASFFVNPTSPEFPSPQTTRAALTTVCFPFWIVLTGVSWIAARADGEDWPHWRGPLRSGIVSEESGWTGKQWVSASPVWKADVGEGSTSPLVVGDRLFVMGWRNQQDTVRCLQADSGQEIWSVSYMCPQYGRLATGDEGLYSGPTSTPEYDADTGFLYTLSCDGDLNCWNANQRGRHVWSVNLYDRFTVERRPKVGRSGLRDYGYTTSPLVHGDWVIVEVGARDGTLMAFAKTTGKLVWKSAARHPAGHTGGLAPIAVQGIPCVAVMTFQGLP